MCPCLAHICIFAGNIDRSIDNVSMCVNKKTMIELKEYLKYYIGCKVDVIGRSPSETILGYGLLEACDELERHSDIIPHLRKLSSLTLNEMTILIGMKVHLKRYPVTDISFNDYAPEVSAIGFYYIGSKQYDCIRFDTLSPAQFHYLISLGVWLWSDEYFSDGSIKEVAAFAMPRI